MTDYTYSAIPDWARLRARYLAYWEGRIADGGMTATIRIARLLSKIFP